MQTLKITKNDPYFELQTELFNLKKMLPESAEDWKTVTEKAAELAVPYDEKSVEFKEICLALDFVERNYKNAQFN